MKRSRSKVLFMVVLGLIMLLALAGCQEDGIPEGDSNLRVNVTDGDAQTTIRVLAEDTEVASEEGEVAEFELPNGIYNLEVGNKTRNVYLVEDTIVDISLEGEREDLVASGFFNESLSSADPDEMGHIDTEGNWAQYLNTGGAGSASVKDGRLVYEVTDTGNEDYSVQLLNGPVKIEGGYKYRVSFDAKGADGRMVTIQVAGVADRAWEPYLWDDAYLSDNWEHYEFEFTMDTLTNEKARFEFWFRDTGMYEIDNIKLEKIGEI